MSADALPSFGAADRPRDVIAWALAHHPDALMTSAFNLNGVVLVDLLADAGFAGEVVFVDTGSHFRETLFTRDRVAERYPRLEVVTLRAEAPDALPDCGSAECCAARKLSPLRAYLAERAPAALFTARSRYQSDTRADLAAVEPGERLKINPLAHQPHALLERYARARRLPVNPLYWQGFLSVGCRPTTRAVGAGEGVRAGRWAGDTKTECGLWLGKEAL